MGLWRSLLVGVGLALLTATAPARAQGTPPAPEREAIPPATVASSIGMPLESTGSIAVASTSGGITCLHEDDRFHNRAILRLNDTSHLD